MSKSADAFRTISEVADWLGIPAHVLRFWESKFTQVKPVKRAGGRRYYRPADMQLLGGIRKLLHDEGMTIKGVQKVMRDHGVRHVAAMSPPLDDDLEEAIAGIALDVTDDEEPRGTVLNFDRARAEAAEADEAGKNAPEAAAEPEPAETTDDPAPADTSADQQADTADAPDHNAAERAAPPPEKPVISTAENDAPEIAQEPSKPAAPAAPSQEARPKEADEMEPAAIGADKTPPHAKPVIHRPATPSKAATAQTPEKTPDAAAAEPDSPETAGTAAPTPDAPAPAPPRVEAITVPDDPADDTPAAASALAALAAIDPADLAAQRPALADLAQRMAELRARMTGGPRSP